MVVRVPLGCGCVVAVTVAVVELFLFPVHGLVVVVFFKLDVVLTAALCWRGEADHCGEGMGLGHWLVTAQDGAEAEEGEISSAAVRSVGGEGIGGSVQGLPVIVEQYAELGKSILFEQHHRQSAMRSL